MAKSGGATAAVTGVVVGMVVAATAAAVAKVTVADAPWIGVDAQVAREFVEAPIGTMLLIAPFVFFASLSQSYDPEHVVRSRWFRAVACALGTGLYVMGFRAAEHALLVRRWTAAALSFLYLFFYAMSLAVALIAVGELIEHIRQRYTR